jgi:hypothetical protein
MSNLVGKLVKTHGIIALPVIMSVGLLMSLSDLRPADAIGGGYGKGRVVLRESGFDFGRTPQQARVAKKFYIVNGGSDTLRIINIDPGCGCTKAPITRDLIPAGDSAQVEIILSSGRKRNAYEKPTKITTSDMFARTVTYDIAAYVIPDGTPTSPVFCGRRSCSLVKQQRLW